MRDLLISTIHRVVIASLTLAGPVVHAKPSEDVVINARVFNGYKRTKLADGKFKPERYGVAEGGRWDGTKVDKSIDGLSFKKIVETIARPLITQGYLPSADPKQTDLLILIFWGTTTGATEGEYDHARDSLLDAMNEANSNSPAFDLSLDSPQNRMAIGADDALTMALMLQSIENRMRDRNNVTNAGILGYTDAYVRARELRKFGFSWGDNTYWELEANRYFVVLKAYDFPFALKEKKLRLLWEARFSIYEQGNRFDEQLSAMTQSAARYFGQDTDGLVHHAVPEGKVEIGTPKVVELPANPNPIDKR